MDTKTKIIGSIPIPIYTTEESRLKTKIKLGIPKSDTDYYVLAKDIIRFTGEGNPVDLESKKLTSYLQTKYPNWELEENLKLKIEELFK